MTFDRATQVYRYCATLFVLALLLGCEAERAEEAVDAQPNILLILADDLGLTDVGYFGGEIPTPNLDALAYEGLRFTNFHTAPACAPTRSMLMSGVSSREAGMVGIKSPLAADVATLPERLQAAGYHTYMAGKWDLGGGVDQGPKARGFESSYVLIPGGDNHLGSSIYPDSERAYRENDVVVSLPEGDWYSSALFADKLIEYIDANKADGQPWFGYLAFTAPHTPIQVPRDWMDRHAGAYDDGYDVIRKARIARANELGVLPDGLTAEGFRGEATAWSDLPVEEQREFSRAMELYAAMVENMDLHIGRLIEYLRGSGQFENTVIFFSSDNGAAWEVSRPTKPQFPHAQFDLSYDKMGLEGSYTAYGRGWGEAATAPYRGVKGSLHSGGTLASAFVHHASIARPGELEETYLSVMDVLPTFVEIAGDRVSGADFQGRTVLGVLGKSFWGLVTGEDPSSGISDRVVPSWSHQDRRRSMVRWPWKVITDQSGSPLDRSVDTDEPLEWMLFNLEQDPGERTDLAAEYPDLKNELIALWESHYETVL